MSPRGGDRGGRKPKLVDKGLRPRQSLNCRVDAEIYDWLKSNALETDLSVGEVVDVAVRCLQKHPGELPSNLETQESELPRTSPQMEFNEWILRQKDRDDPIGALVNDILSVCAIDKNFDYQSLKGHMMIEGACSEALAALNEAFAEYSKGTMESTN